MASKHGTSHAQNSVFLIDSIMELSAVEDVTAHKQAHRKNMLFY